MNEQIKSVPGGRVLLKAILQALAILAVAAGLSQALLFPLIQGSLLASVQRWEVEYLNGGTAELLAAELNSIPANQRVARLSQLSAQFGFAISIEEMQRTGLDSNNLARLRNFEVVGDPTTYSTYKLLGNANQVLVFGNTKLPAPHLVTEAQRRTMGTFAMLENSLHGSPEETWGDTIRSAADLFGFPVRLVNASELNLTPSQLVDLGNERIVEVATDDSAAADYPAEMVYKTIGSSVMALGPFSPPTLRRFYPVISGYYILLAIVILIPLGLWLAPTWRSMNRLSHATTSFGLGNFAVRAKPVSGSNANYLISIFNQMAEKIQSLVGSNKALINSVSHELRTPISRIEFNIELARQSTDIDMRNKQLDRIEDSVDELKTMVTEMLQYARFDREIPNFTMESVEIGEWLNGELENWTSTKKNTNIQIEAPQTPVRAFIERYYMSRAISNLVLNAIRHADSVVVVSTKASGNSCEISVSDDGPGVAYQDRTRIFEPFVRQDESRNRESGGTGLGLAIVKQIADWHSGDVWVEDAEIGGAKFVLRWSWSEEGDTDE